MQGLIDVAVDPSLTTPSRLLHDLWLAQDVGSTTGDQTPIVQPVRLNQSSQGTEKERLYVVFYLEDGFDLKLRTYTSHATVQEGKVW